MAQYQASNVKIIQEEYHKDNNNNTADSSQIPIAATATPIQPNAKPNYTGYIGMLAVTNPHRRSGIGSALAIRAILQMKQFGCNSICLETEVTNKGAMRLYEDRLGFVREELLVKYYLNWGDAYRLRLWLDG